MFVRLLFLFALVPLIGLFLLVPPDGDRCRL